ncbi:MAG: alanine dehydrogenase [Pseudomonadota bacterium]|jgi:alanine dehydrogenase
MIVGVPKEIKNHEHRVGLTPASVRELVEAGHRVLVQSGAGTATGMEDGHYRAAGAQLAGDAAEIYAQAELLVKVKEPQPQECALLRPGQVLFTFLHLAADAALTAALVRSGAVCIAYETITGPGGGLPLLAPMSEVAGRMSVQVAACLLEKSRGGQGVLLGGVPGVPAARLAILGAGVVGSNALQIAVGMGARVTALDRDLGRLRQLDRLWGNRIATRHATAAAIEEEVLAADAVIGSVLLPGAAAPKLVGRTLVARMKPGSVLVDVAIDQGGCFETSRPTTHTDPTFVVDGVLHYAVTNMPGAVARTSTLALNNATLPHVLALARLGWRGALRADAHLRDGLNVCEGQLTHPAVAQALGYPPVAAEQLLG